MNGLGLSDISMYAPADTTPTIEELIGSSHVSDSIGGSLSWHLMTAPFALSVVTLAIASTSGQAANDTDYWTFTLRRFRAGASVTIAEKTTRTVASGGGGMFTANSDYNFDDITFDVSNKVLAKGDLLNLNFAKSGAASTLGRTTVTWRYQPT